MNQSVPASVALPRIRPAYMAHFVIRTTRYAEIVRWYREFFDADVVFANEMVTFLTFDQEHHRIAIGNLPGLDPHNPRAAGIDHVAFSFSSLGDLVATYERLKGLDVKPYWCINHGPTTSMYFKDPDGVQVELQVDNTAAVGDPKQVFKSPSFAADPIGVEFDPDALSAKFHAGVPVAQLMQQGSAPRAA